MKKTLLFLFCAIITCSAAVASDDSDALKVYNEYLTATSSKDLGKAISLMDKTAPDYQAQLKGIAEAMLNTNLSFKITSAKLVGKTGDYIVLRIIQENSPKTPNPKIKTVIVDALQIFKKGEDNKWRFRNSQILSAKVKE